MALPTIVFNGALINGEEIAFAYDVPKDAVVTTAHLHIQFRYGFSLDIPDLTAEGLQRLLAGDPF